MKIYAKTDVGLVRNTNEDAYFFKETENSLIAFVCDGMGGHLGGLYAANQTIKVIDESFSTINNEKNSEIWLYNCLQKANKEIYETAMTNDEYRGMGTTVTGVLKQNNIFYYAHAGDSRIYLYDDDEIQQITTDHTLVNSLLHSGYITYKQSLRHPKKHVLTNALGLKKDLSVDIGTLNIKPGQNILICSDGLYNSLDLKKMHRILKEPLTTIVEKGAELLDKALQTSGHDNITFIIIEM